jgi:DNA-binding transcriptional regulator/RsmH inhibitor MraZ
LIVKVELPYLPLIEAQLKKLRKKCIFSKSLKYLCLEIHLASKINSLVKSFDEKDFFFKKNDHFKAAILSDLEEINIDNDGRFTLRDTHQSFSKLKKEILFIGKGNHFEIWQKDLGEKHKLESRKKFQ